MTTDYFKYHPFIEQDINARSLSFYCKREISYIDEEMLCELKKIAISEDRGARISLHASSAADLHNMLICQHKHTYTMPHKHLSKAETYHIIEGEMSLFIFNNSGDIFERIDMSSRGKILCRVDKDYYHTLVPTTQHVVFHESRTGPFLRDGDSILPKWAIASDDKKEVMHFIQLLLKFKGLDSISKRWKNKRKEL